MRGAGFTLVKILSSHTDSDVQVLSGEACCALWPIYWTNSLQDFRPVSWRSS